MADAIKVTMEPTNFKVAPGGNPVTVRLNIQNAGTIVDQYTLQLSDLPDNWYTLPKASVALFPNDRDSLTFQIHPPAGINTRAGTYTFTVSVISQADSRQATRIPATLVVTAVDAFELDMTPRKVIGRKGRFTVTLKNGGNSDVEVLLEAVDPEEACNFRLSHEEAHLEPGQKDTVKLVVKPRRQGWFGQRKEFRFEVRAKPGQGAAKVVQGQIVHKPRLRSIGWMRKLGTLGAIAGILGYFYFTQGQLKGIEAKLSPYKKPVTDWACIRIGVLCGTLTPTITVTPIFSSTPTPIPSSTSVPTAVPTSPSGTGGSGGNGGSGGSGGTGGSGGSGGNGGTGGGKPSPVPHPTHAAPTPRPIFTATPRPQIIQATPAPTAKPTLPAAPTFTPVPTSTPIPTNTAVPTETPIPTSTPLALPGEGSATPGQSGALVMPPSGAQVAFALSYSRAPARIPASIPQSPKEGLVRYGVS